MCSGGNPHSVDRKMHRIMRRGNYTDRDNPCLQLSREHGDTVEALETNCVFDLSEHSKAVILDTLCTQLLTCMFMRGAMEESASEAKELRKVTRALLQQEQEQEEEEEGQEQHSGAGERSNRT